MDVNHDRSINLLLELTADPPCDTWEAEGYEERQREAIRAIGQMQADPLVKAFLQKFLEGCPKEPDFRGYGQVESLDEGRRRFVKLAADVLPDLLQWKAQRETSNESFVAFQRAKAKLAETDPFMAASFANPTNDSIPLRLREVPDVICNQNKWGT